VFVLELALHEFELADREAIRQTSDRLQERHQVLLWKPTHTSPEVEEGAEGRGYSVNL